MRNDDIPPEVRWEMWYREARLRTARVELEWWILVLTEMQRRR